jgi:hypothetical protein
MNSYYGSGAGYSTTSGSYNVFIGRYAGRSNTTGNNNTFIGYESGNSNMTSSGNTFIGYQSGKNEITSNKLYIDNSDTASPLIYGDFSTDELTINGDLTVTDSTLLTTLAVSGNSTLGNAASDTLTVTGRQIITGDLSISDSTLLKTLSVSGNSTFNDTLFNIKGTDTTYMYTNSDTTYIYTTNPTNLITSGFKTTKLISDSLILGGDTLDAAIDLTSYIGNFGNSSNPNDTAYFSYITGINILTIGTITDADKTPDVTGSNMWLYGGFETSDTLTNLDNAIIGVKYTLIGNSDTYLLVIEDSENFKLSSSVALGINDNITLLCIAANTFIEIAKSNN